MPPLQGEKHLRSKGVPDLLSGFRSGWKILKSLGPALVLVRRLKTGPRPRPTVTIIEKFPGINYEAIRGVGPKSIILLSQKVFYVPACKPLERIILLKLIPCCEGWDGEEILISVPRNSRKINA